MASLYKRGNRYWISYYYEGVHVCKSLHTTLTKVAEEKKRKIAIGDLQPVSKLPVPKILEAFCQHLHATRTYKSYKNNFSRLRVFFSPVCPAPKLRSPGPRAAGADAKPPKDRYAGKHVKVALLVAPLSTDARGLCRSSVRPAASSAIATFAGRRPSWALDTIPLIKLDRRVPCPTSIGFAGDDCQAVDRRASTTPHAGIRLLPAIEGPCS
jgi:hypothetical protein